MGANAAHPTLQNSTEEHFCAVFFIFFKFRLTDDFLCAITVLS